MSIKNNQNMESYSAFQRCSHWTFYANVTTLRLPYVIANPSVVCLSVCRLWRWWPYA